MNPMTSNSKTGIQGAGSQNIQIQSFIGVPSFISQRQFTLSEGQALSHMIGVSSFSVVIVKVLRARPEQDCGSFYWKKLKYTQFSMVHALKAIPCLPGLII